MGIGGTIVSYLVLREIGALLGAIVGTTGAGVYTTQVFNGFHPLVHLTGDLESALELWARAELDSGLGVRSWLLVHVLFDLLFVVGYASLLGRALWQTGIRAYRFLLTTIVVADLAETFLMGVLVTSFWPDVGDAEGMVGTSGGLFGPAPWAVMMAMRTASVAKWIAVTAAAVVLVVVWVPRTIRFVRAERARDEPFRNGFPATAGQSILVAVFVALIAIPVGGPLEQVPDILRYQLTSDRLGIQVAAMTSVVFFAAVTAASGLIGARSLAETRAHVGNWQMVVTALAVTAVLSTIRVAVDRSFDLVTVAPVLVVIVVIGFSSLVGGVTDPPSSGPAEPAPVDGASIPIDRRVVDWVGALAGVVIVGSGLGLLRAALPIVILDPDPSVWWLWILAGLLVAIVGGAIAQRVVALLVVPGDDPDHRHLTPLGRMASALALVGSLAAGAMLLARPGWAEHVGATGAAALLLSTYATVVAGLQWLSRRGIRWTATTDLRIFGHRTPWTTLAVGWLVVASVFNTDGGYHDVRTADGAGPHRYPTLADAIDTWIEAQDAIGCPEPAAGEPIPMVLVAAPGGGIRAAHWTATALTELFPDDCARRRVLALSTTSGGSIGALLWTASLADTHPDPRPALTAISGDEPIAAAIAGLLARDLPQTFTGITSGWRDRAALLEDAWTERAGVLGTRSDPLTMAELGGDRRWVPITVFNSASVSNGCRVLVTNTGGLPVAEAGNCLGPGTARSGPISVSTDAGVALVADRESCRPRSLPAVTGGLLSARFPYITPSGAVHHCEPPEGRPAGGDTGDSEPHRWVTYAVDGGYFENSGILALLELLDEVDSLTIDGAPVEPWLVVLSSGYRSRIEQPPAERPPELLVPLITITGSNLITQPALEQSAAARLARPEGCTNLVVLAPSRAPDIAAPLGWALSDASRSSLDRSLDASLAEERSDPCSGRLWEALGG
jgi:hypothetical protein